MDDFQIFGDLAFYLVLIFLLIGFLASAIKILREYERGAAALPVHPGQHRHRKELDHRLSLPDGTDAADAQHRPVGQCVRNSRYGRPARLSDGPGRSRGIENQLQRLGGVLQVDDHNVHE